MVGVLFRRGRIAPIAANDFQKKILVKQQASKEVGWIVWSTCDGPFDVMQTRSRDSDCPQRQWGSCGGITHTNTYTACRFVGRVGTERINTWPWPLQFILLSLSLSFTRCNWCRLRVLRQFTTAPMTAQTWAHESQTRYKQIVHTKPATAKEGGKLCENDELFRCNLFIGMSAWKKITWITALELRRESACSSNRKKGRQKNK